MKFPITIIPQIQIVFLLILSLCICDNYAIAFSSSQYTNEAYHHKHILGPDGNFTLEWKVQWENKSITFNVSAECNGYIGLGLSKTGSISDSDFVIGGIDSSGKPYFSDMHGIANGTLQEDYRNDWTLIDAVRRNGRIYLSFSRSLETCDDEDYQISGDLVHVIWAYGDTDEITLFSPHHGNETFYLLDPDLTTEIANNIYRQIGPHSNLYLMQRWTAITRQNLPTKTNSQMCSIIKGPNLLYKHYILGGGAYLPFQKSKTHVKQIVLSRCVPPPDRNASLFFDSLVKRQGQECNSFQNSSSLPKHLCTQIIFVWGIGGKPFYFPEEFGIPIGILPDEYYLLEVHYHNPDNAKDLTVKAGLELMIHPRPRSFEGGFQMISYGMYGLFTIPPRSAAFSVYGHCSSQCTKDMIPKDGLKVIAALLQMRGTGKNIRLRHFRGTKELPWIISDDNYESSFQQIRLLSKPVVVLPGDQLTVQCTYDTLGIPNTTFSGSSHDQEVCTAYLLIDQSAPFAWCSSEYSVENQLKYLGIQNSLNNITNIRGVTTNSNALTVRKTLSLPDKNIRWSPSARAALQREMLHGMQISSCPSQIQVAKSARARRFNVISNLSRKSQINIASSVPSFITPFASNTVTIPNISLGYRPVSECQRNNVLLNNFGFHRNVITGKYQSRISPLSLSSSNKQQEEMKRTSNIRNDILFRRIYG